jgi:hypothetical protein
MQRRKKMAQWGAAPPKSKSGIAAGAPQLRQEGFATLG